MKISVNPIGIIHSPFTKPEDIPKPKKYDPYRFETTQGEIEVYPEYQEGLKDIDGFSHLIILFSFHKSKKIHLTAHPPMDNKPRGIFATRSPHRPNLIGMSVVKLLSRKDNILKISGIDMIEGTPLLDIKPYTQRDLKEDIRLGWIDSVSPKVSK
ncbi:tRNA (N6-threonylcarbamoyladenosine(37)-N6)-methyltransferase TrmO [Acidobacteriota bacterium]